MFHAIYDGIHCPIKEGYIVDDTCFAKLKLAYQVPQIDIGNDFETAIQEGEFTGKLAFPHQLPALAALKMLELHPCSRRHGLHGFKIRTISQLRVGYVRLKRVVFIGLVDDLFEDLIMYSLARLPLAI